MHEGYLITDKAALGNFKETFCPPISLKQDASRFLDVQWRRN